jgi:hypothetical protein
LRVADRANPELKDLLTQLKAAQAAPVPMTQTATPAESIPDETPDQSPATVPAEVIIDWDAWATSLAARPHVTKAFAVSLSDSGTLPFSVLAEKGAGVAEPDTVSICMGMFTALDGFCRAHGAGVIGELRVERADGEIWCRRLPRSVIGFAGENGLAYGAMRKQAMDDATHVAHPESNQ